MAKIWDAVSGQELLALQGDAKSATCVAWSPDGRRLATNGDGMTAKVWDAANGRELLTLRGRAVIDDAAFSPDSKRLATTDGNGEVTLWGTASGQDLMALRGQTDTVYSVAFSNDGKSLAAANKGGTVQIYASDIRQLLDLAHKRVTRAPPELTYVECQRYFQSECPPDAIVQFRVSS